MVQQLGKSSQHLDHFEISLRNCLVDLVVLHKEQSKLDDLCSRIEDNLHALVLSLQEQELPD